MLENNAIESRTQVTNQAIIDAVLAESAQTVIDIGCGEGWLVRALAAHGLNPLGVDGVPQLIDYAQKAGGGRFQTLTYEEIANGQLQGDFDVAICNFSLLGKETTRGLFSACPQFLHPNGRLIIQTLYPVFACGIAPYEDGWRSGSWAGIQETFAAPAPWYFRTFESWVTLFTQHGFRLTHLYEPIHPQTGHPSSVIFVGQLS